MFKRQKSNLVTSDDKCCIRILHVDDDSLMLEVSKQILLDMGNFEIDVACCVDEAFKKLAAGDFDVVVSDYEMPNKDGLQFLKELREANNEIPFILFTGKGREEVAIKALNLGADGYMNKQGSPETVYGELSHNIKNAVEHHKAKNDLFERDLRLTKLAAQTPGMLYQFLRRPDGSFCVPYASNNIQVIFGCSPQDVLNDFSPIAKVIVPEDFDKVVSSIEHSAAHMTPWQCEYRVQLPGLQIRWLWGQALPERIKDGGVLWNGYNADITERKKVEGTLRLSEEKLRSVFAASPEALTTWALTGHILDCNPAAAALHGYGSKEELIGKSILVFVAKKDHKRALERMAAYGPVKNLEFTFVAKDGHEFPAEISVNVVLDALGKPAYYMAITKDITERKQAEEKARKNESERIEQLTLLSDFSSKLNLAETLDETCRIFCSKIKEIIGPGYVTVTLMDKAEQSLTVKATAGFDDKGMTNSAVRLLGGDPLGAVYYLKDMLPEELKLFRSGKLELFAGGLHAAMTRKYPKVACQMLEHLMGIHFVYTFGFIHKNRHLGGAMIMLNSQDAIQKNTGLIETLIGQTSPVISRFFTELKLRDSEEKHRIISSLIVDVAFSCVKPEGGSYVIDWISGAVEKVFGYSSEEIKKRGCWRFLVDPQDFSIFDEKIARLSLGQSSTCELRIIHADCPTRWIKVSSRVEKDQATPKTVRLFGACENITDPKQTHHEMARSFDKRVGV